MPYAIEWKRRGVVKTFSGVVSSQELVDSFREVGAHPLFDDLFFILSDFRAVTKLELEAWAIQEMAAMRLGSSHTNGGARAVMVGGEEIRELERAMGRAPLEDTRETRFFRSMALARQWLKSQPPPIRRESR